MLSLSCEHPDLEEFIGVKSDLDRVTKANISIRITDKFMVAVKNRQPFTLSFTRTETGETITKEVDAYSIFKKICEMNWDYAEPGMLFWDRVENWNLLSNDDNFHYAGTNPCAEEPLPAGGSCLLGSINLSEFVTDNKTFNFDDFRNTVSIAVKALNEVLDEGLPLHPLQEQKDSVRDWRQIGLGIFGLADMLIKMNIRYGSEEAVTLCDAIGYAMAYEAIETSSNLATESNPYPMYDKDSINQSAFWSKHTSIQNRDKIYYAGLRNSQLLTIAPTGTLSTMLGVSGGIEPIYANYYTRKTESLHGEDKYYKVYTPIVDKYMKEHNIKDDSDLPDFFVTAQTLDYRERIDMQSIWQNHIDASISSTINVPNDFTVEQVEDLYMYAWEKGLKGVTIFRDGCKRVGILSTDNTNKEEKEESKTTTTTTVSTDKDNTTFSFDNLPRGVVINVDNDVIGKKRKLITGCGSLHCIALFDPTTGDLLETYLSKGSTGGCNNFMVGLSRMISTSARGGVDIYTIVDQLKSTGACPSYAVRSATKHDTSKGSCCPMAVGNALLDMYEELHRELFVDDDDDNEEKPEVKPQIKKATVSPAPQKEVTVATPKKNPCPSCGEELTFEGGCNICKNCGWSKCD